MSILSSGKDATQDFDEIGHSNSAKKMLDKYLIGKYKVRTIILCPKILAHARSCTQHTHACNPCIHFLSLACLHPVILHSSEIALAFTGMRSITGSQILSNL